MQQLERYRGSLLGLAAGDALGAPLEFIMPWSFKPVADMVGGGYFQLAPVPLFFARNPREAIEKSGQSSRTTHGVVAAVDACRYLGALLVGAVNGCSKEELLAERYSPVLGYWAENPLTPEIDEVAAGSFKRRQPPQIRGTGYVAKSLEAALWAFYRSDSFREGCLMAVNLGDDADTTGAIYGQLVGAYYGEHGIPESWRAKLARRDLIESYAERLFFARPED